MDTSAINRRLSSAELDALEPDVRLGFQMMLRERQRDGVPGFGLSDDLIDQVSIAGRKVGYNPLLGDAFAWLCLDLSHGSTITCQFMRRIFESPKLPQWFSIMCISERVDR